MKKIITTIIGICALLISCAYSPETEAASQKMEMKDFSRQTPSTRMMEVETSEELMDVMAEPAPFNPEPDKTDFNVINENEFFDPFSQPLSTFSIDVDTAAYSVVRNYLNDNRLPNKDAVRIEEMINYFSYDYPDPRNTGVPFSLTTELSTAPWNPEHQLLLIGLQGKKVQQENLPNSNLVFLLDVSGSMNSPNKLPLVKRAFNLLADRLTKKDTVAIVVYAGASGLVLPATPGNESEKINVALNQLEAGGSTAGAAGIELAYKVAMENYIEGGNNRVIIATDGDFNVGLSGQGELERFIAEKKESGVYLSVLGFGDSHYMDATMELLADKGNGNYAFIDTIREAKKVLGNEMAGTLLTIAKDVKIQVEFNPALVKGYRLIGYENRVMDAQDFDDDKKDAGELGAGHSVTALYELIPASSNEDVPNAPELRFQTNELSDASESGDLAFVKLRYKEPDEDESKLIETTVKTEASSIEIASENLRFASAVTELGLILRDSKFKGTANFADLIARAKAAQGSDEFGYRRDFIQLAESADLIVQTEQ